MSTSASEASVSDELQYVVQCKAYRYDSLELNQIRVLELLPGEDSDGLECSLRTVLMNEQPEYEAISYAWGSKDPPAYIWCNTGYVRITTNLADGLRQLREPGRVRTLWADQICINQDNIPERSAQVNIMGDIFREATLVLVWLGPDDELEPQAPLARKIVEKLADLPRRDDPAHLYWNLDELEEFGIPRPSSSAWTALDSLVERPYFGRIWTLQEISLASKVCVRWGSTLIDIGLLTKCAGAIESLGRGVFSTTSWKDTMNFWTTLLMPDDLRHNTLSSCELAHFARQKKATDPRDSIFALLPMVSHHPNKPSADYSQSLLEVYISAARFCLEEEPDSLRFLTYAGSQHRDNPSQHWEVWPSWVPSFPPEFLATICLQRRGFCADARQQRIVNLFHHQTRPILQVDGVPITRISHVRREDDFYTSQETLFFDIISEAGGLYRRSLAENPSTALYKHSLLATLLRTTISGSYDNIEFVGGEKFDPAQMYEDLVIFIAEFTLSNLVTGRLNSLQQLNYWLDMAKRAFECAWLTQLIQSNQPLRDQMCISAATIRQRYKRQSTELPPSTQVDIERANSMDPRLKCDREEYDAAVDLLSAFLVVDGKSDRLNLTLNRQSHSLFVTEDASFGRGPPAIQPGDMVTILFGWKAPFLLRPTSVPGEYHLLGDCYVDGIMHGEFIEKLKSEGRFEDAVTSFTLV